MDSSINDLVCSHTVDYWNKQLTEFNWNSKCNAEAEMELLGKNLLFRKRFMPLEEKKSGDIDRCDEIMEKLFDRLLNSLIEEGWHRSSLLFENVEESKNSAKLMNWNDAYKYIGIAMGILRPFDIEEMLRLYKETEQAAEEVSGKNICLVLGHTGRFYSIFSFVLAFLCVFTQSGVSSELPVSCKCVSFYIYF